KDLFDFREDHVETGGEGERWQRRTDREAEPDDHEVQSRPGEPAREGRAPPARRRLEEVAWRIALATHYKGLVDHDSQQRDEESSDPDEERHTRATDPLGRAV